MGLLPPDGCLRIAPGITRSEAVGIHEVCTIFRLSRPHRPSYLKPLAYSLLAQALTAVPKLEISKTAPCYWSSVDPRCVAQVVRIHR